MKKIFTLCLTLILSVSLSLASLKAHHRNPNENHEYERIYGQIHIPQRQRVQQQETLEDREHRLRQEAEAKMKTPEIKAARAVIFIVMGLGAFQFFESLNAKPGYQPLITPETLYGLLSWPTLKSYIGFQGLKYGANLLTEKAEVNPRTPAQNRRSRVTLGVKQLLAAGVILGTHCMIMSNNSEDEDTSGVKSLYTTYYGPHMSLIGASEMFRYGINNLIGALTGWW